MTSVHKATLKVEQYDGAVRIAGCCSCGMDILYGSEFDLDNIVEVWHRHVSDTARNLAT